MIPYRKGPDAQANDISWRDQYTLEHAITDDLRSRLNGAEIARDEWKAVAEQAEADAKAQAANFEAANRRLDAAASQAYDLVKEVQAAESALTELRGEAVMLQLAIAEAVGELAEIHRRATVPPPMPSVMGWTYRVLADGDVERLEAAVKTLTMTMMPTGRAAALGALVEAALRGSELERRRQTRTTWLESVSIQEITDFLDDLRVKADALAAMGKEGAGQ